MIAPTQLQDSLVPRVLLLLIFDRIVGLNIAGKSGNLPLVCSFVVVPLKLSVHRQHVRQRPSRLRKIEHFPLHFR